VETAAKMKERATKADELYDAACLYALCAAAADRDRPSPPAPLPQRGERGEKKKQLADEAMKLLQQAVAKGYNNATHMARDRDLDALRQRDDFKKLLAELEAKNAKQSK
jgi:hypothetical protein